MRFSPVRALWRLVVTIVVVALVATTVTLIGRLILSDRSADPPTSGSVAKTLAADIWPTITNIERCHRATGSYPLALRDLVGCLPTGVMVDAAEDALSLDIGRGTVWIYLRHSDGRGYELSRHLPDGGSLVATNENGRFIWSYAETDDDDPEPVTIPPPP